MSRPLPPRTDLSAGADLFAPRFAAGWAALVYTVAAMLLAYPALGGGFLVSPQSDQYIAGYAFREFAAASLKAGEGFPQWNPYLFGGMPYIAAMHGDIFYPTFLLRMLLPTDVAMTWGFIIHLFLAGFFTFAFLRAYGVGFRGALIGGLGYMLSGPIAGLASPGHDGKLFVSALLPLSLWMLVRLIRDGRLWAWGAFALTIGLAFLTPHPQLFQYLLLASGAFALFLAFGTHDGVRLSRHVALTRLGMAFGGVVLGVCMGAVQYMPALLEYEKWSPRAGGAGYDHAVSYSMPIEELLNAVVPQFSGLHDRYWGRNSIHFHSEYPGVVVLILAGAGIFAQRFSRGFRWFWTGTLIVSVLWALGGYTPFYRIIYEVVPYTKYLRAPSTMMFLSMFALSVLSALGAERILTSASSLSKRFLFGWPGFLAAVAVVIAAGLTISVAQNVGAYMAQAPQYARYQPDQVIAAWAERARENQPDVLLGALRSIVLLALAVAVIWARASERLSVRTTAIVLGALVAIDLWSIERKYWLFSPPAAQTFASDPAIDYLRGAPEPARTVAWDALDSAVPRDPAFTDMLMTHRVRLVGGYHGNELDRYQQLMTLRVSEAAPSFMTPQFWRHENVQYWYTTVPDSLMPQVSAQLQMPTSPLKLVGPVRNARGSTVYLYRLPGANPAAWVASVMVKGTDEQALATVMDPRFDPTRAAILDNASAIPAAQPTTAPAPAGVQATVTRLEPGRIDVLLDKPAPEGSALVVSENFYPGWRATAEGRELPLARANFNLIGAALPAGARRVELRFSDAQYATGKLITLVCIVLALLAIAAGAFVERRKPTPAT